VIKSSFPTGTTKLAPAGREFEPRDDAFGQVEERGCEYIPEEDRNSKPANLLAVFIGANLSLSVIVFGALPITFGLGWWSAVTSVVVGSALGALVSLPAALLSPRTGTNSSVSSGAHFGVSGRLIGSALNLAVTLIFIAVSVWTGTDALVGASARLFGTPQDDIALTLGYVLVTAAIILIGVYGHSTVVMLERLAVPVVGVVMILGLIAFAGDFDAGYRGGDYLLGDFWKTWILSVVVAASAPVSYAGVLGDYTRRISRQRYSDRQVALAVGTGLFVGTGLPALFGAYTALTFTEPSDSYVLDLVAAAPHWYVYGVIVMAVLGTAGQGVLSLYSAGLSFEAIMPRFNRMQATLVTAVTVVGLIFLGALVLDAVDTLTAVSLMINAIIVPWIVVISIGFLYRGRYFAGDLFVFIEGRRGGRYWFVGGWNPRAVVAWAAGASFGVLATNTTLFVGPFANIADGIDMSLVGSGVLTGSLYGVALAVWPERVPVSEGDEV
jgi:purine-cytosine permease-like protein